MRPVFLAAIAAALFLAYFELHTDDAGVEAALLLASSVLLGYLEPRHAWRWGAILGAAIPLSDLLVLKHNAPGVAAFTIAFALAGSYMGAGIRRFTSPPAA